MRWWSSSPSSSADWGCRQTASFEVCSTSTRLNFTILTPTRSSKLRPSSCCARHIWALGPILRCGGISFICVCYRPDSAGQKGSKTPAPVGCANVQLRSKMMGQYPQVPLKKSLKWHSEWFYVKNHAEPLRDPLPKFTGKIPKDSKRWKLGVTKKEMKDVEVMVDMIGALKEQGLSGAGLCWTFFAMRVQPLKIRAHFMWDYSDHTDPIRESADELAQLEIAVRLLTVLELKQEKAMTVFNGHPAPRSLKTDLPNVSLPSRPCFCYNLN
jgi:hypothetical protein